MANKRKSLKNLSDWLGEGSHQFEGSLLEDRDSVRSEKKNIHSLGVDQLRRGRYQPREPLDDDEIAELAQTIRQLGVIEPIAVRPSNEEDVYEILAGDRRWRAAQQAGLDQVPVIVHDVDDRTAAAIALVENLQRKKLNPIEEAQAMRRLIDEFELSQGQVAEIVGKSQSVVSKSLGLLDLDHVVQSYIQREQLEAGHGKVLLNLDRGDQVRLAEQTIKLGWSVRELEQQKAALKIGKTTRKRHLTRRTDPNIVQMENQMQEWLGAKVRFKYNSTKGNGRIEINFTNLDECNGILEKFGLLKDS
jgi:ParB family chromosome partitioning protein